MRDESTFREWIIASIIIIATIAVTEKLNLSDNWKDSCVFTAIVFSCVIAGLRSIWTKKAFWFGLVLIFILHVSIMIPITRSRSEESSRYTGLPLIGSMSVEAFIIGGILWKITHFKRSIPPKKLQ
jgi:hypothetical protein